MLQLKTTHHCLVKQLWMQTVNVSLWTIKANHLLQVRYYPSVERFAHKMKYARLDISVINTVMSQMADRCENPTGNTWVFAVNKILWSQINTSLMSWLANWNSAATMLYSKAAGGMVKVPIRNFFVSICILKDDNLVYIL